MKDKQDLGEANGWSRTPAIVTECMNKNHRVISEKIGKCYFEYTCDVCNYTYRVDSGG